MHFPPKILGLSASEKFTPTKVSHIFHIELWETFAFTFWIFNFNIFFIVTIIYLLIQIDVKTSQNSR